MATADFPDYDQHTVAAGKSGSGKSWAMLNMLARRLDIPWLIIDNKKDSNIAKLRLEKIPLNPLIIPTDNRPYLVQPSMGKKAASDRQEVEDFLFRIFDRRGNKPTRYGVYVDEGHLFGFSPAIRQILVAGRDKQMPLMYTSQRATGIDPFIWGQSTFLRAFKLQTTLDIKRFNENFPQKYTALPDYWSHYYDGNNQYQLGPSGDLNETIRLIDRATGPKYGAL